MSTLIRQALHHWQSMPLYLRTLIGMAIGAVLGTTMGPDAVVLAKPGSILMGLVQMLAAPVAFFAIVHALAGAKIEQGKTGALIRLLATNTLVAILVGLLVANFLRPGERRGLTESDKAKVEAQAISMSGQIATAEANAKESGLGDKVMQILEKLPRSVMGPFTDGGSVIGVIVLALMLGLALRKVSPDPDATVQVVKVFMDAFIAMLHWIVQLVPVIVLGVVAGEVGLNGFGSFFSLLWLIAAVLLALAIQFIYYMSRIWLQSWVSPVHLIRGCRDALAMAFSTASSTATMPLTYQCLVERVKVRKSSANLGALVGANFNNDGTA
ncbi:MAG: dicarboxylate/amino acid:cation symporter, partial [Luteolibacter sp.]